MKKIISILLILQISWSIKAQKNIEAEKFFSKAKSLMAENLYDKAMESIDSAIRIDSLQEDYYIQKIDICQKKMDCEAAENTLLEYVSRINPKTENIFLYTSKLYVECADDKEIGLQILKSALDGPFSNSKNIVKQIVLLYIQLGDNENTIRYLNKYLELVPNDIESHNNLFELLFVLNRFDEAENVLLLGLKKNGEDLSLLTKLSKYYYNRKKYELCISVLNRILKKQYNVENIKNRAIVYEETNQLDKAYGDYEKIIEIDKCNIEFYTKILSHEYKSRMYEKVISNSLNLIKCNPDYEKIVIDGLYTSLFFCKDFEKGIEYLDKRLLSKPNKYLPYYLKAITLFNQKSYNQALSYIESALECNNISSDEISKINILKYGIYLVTEDYGSFAKIWKENDSKQLNNELSLFVTPVNTESEKIVLSVSFDKKTGLINTSLIVPNVILKILNDKYGIEIINK